MKYCPSMNMSSNMGPGASTAYNPGCLTSDIASTFSSEYLSLANTLWNLAA